MGLRLKKSTSTARRKSKYDTIATSGHQIILDASGNRVAFCNRCGRSLTAESSYIRGIGPVCARRAFAALGDLKGQTINSTFEQEMLVILDGVVTALTDEVKALDRETDHRTRITTELCEGTDRAKALEIAYEILGDVYAQMPTGAKIQGAVATMFLTIGANDEAEQAKKRLRTLSKKF